MAAMRAARTPLDPAPMTKRSQSYSAIGGLHQVARAQPLDAVVGSDQRLAGEAEEEAVLDHAGDALQRRLDAAGIEDSPARGVIEEVAGIGHDGRSVLAAQPGRRRDAAVGQAAYDAPERRGVAEGDDFDRQRVAPEARSDLALVSDDDAAPRGFPDQLFAQQRPAAALDQGKPRPDLVRAVDRQVDGPRLVQIDQ